MAFVISGQAKAHHLACPKLMYAALSVCRSNTSPWPSKQQHQARGRFLMSSRQKTRLPVAVCFRFQRPRRGLDGFNPDPPINYTARDAESKVIPCWLGRAAMMKPDLFTSLFDVVSEMQNSNPWSATHRLQSFDDQQWARLAAKSLSVPVRAPRDPSIRQTGESGVQQG